MVTEKIWFNCEPDRLHWARLAGRNFTNRQRIKRKAENWGRRYGALLRAERLAVLTTMMAVEGEWMPNLPRPTSPHHEDRDPSGELPRSGRSTPSVGELPNPDIVNGH